jgi:ubiquinone/menaquinone biosynthesis C-methylase UbiE
VETQPVQDAYSSMSERYIDVCGSISQEHEADIALVQRSLTGLDGRVLDLGCGPGHWTGHLHSLGADITGIDLVPEFIAHARANHPEIEFRVGSMTEVDTPEHSVAGVLSWYSTIHLPPAELEHVLREFRRLLQPSGMLVIGFFDSHDGVSAFDHAVMTAYRWPADVFAEHLAKTGFTEVERLQYQRAERADRRYAAIAARAAI